MVIRISEIYDLESEAIWIMASFFKKSLILKKKLKLINRLLKCLFFGHGSGKRIHISEIELYGQYSSNN